MPRGVYTRKKKTAAAATIDPGFDTILQLILSKIKPQIEEMVNDAILDWENKREMDITDQIKEVIRDSVSVELDVM